MTKHEHYRFEGGPTGRDMKIYRDGVMVPGVTAFHLSSNVYGIVKLRLTQYVELVGSITVDPDAVDVEEAPPEERRRE